VSTQGPDEGDDDGTAQTSAVRRNAPEYPEALADRIRRTRRRVGALKWTLRLVIAAALAGVAYWELRTARVQSMVFNNMTSGTYFYVEDGKSPSIVFPDSGPYDKRVGYADMPTMLDDLTESKYRISRQARVSDQFAELVERGLFAPYPEKQRAGLRITDAYDNRLHTSVYPTRYYESFEQIPDLLVDTLLFIENRSLLDKDRPHRNPALEPDRFLRALAQVAIRELAGGDKPSGGSTLATQIQKFRHSAEGYTASYQDKFQQMMSASVRAYLDGKRTLDDQKRIVRTYLNAVPLSAVEGFGEVFGVGDGLHAWFETDFERANRLLELASTTGTRASTDTVDAQARVYRQALSLIIAQRRPSHFLRRAQDPLAELTDRYLHRLERRGIISEAFRDRVLQTSVSLEGPPVASREPSALEDEKLVYSLRTDLLEETDRESLYELDRLDLRARTTVDYDVQRSVERVLDRLRDPAFVEKHRLNRWRLLGDNDPSNVIYSFTLYERTPTTNKLRIQADTYDGPFNVNEGVKLNLGSTAKLRTIASYLQIVADLWIEYRNMSESELEELSLDRRDRISRWVREYRLDHPEAALQTVVDAAMERRYSAEPDSFLTGGGQHHFENFSYKYNDEWPTVRTGLENSINLVFVRLMRDIVRYHMFRLPDADREILMDPDHPKREMYLKKFARQEGKTFLRKFWKRYEGWNDRQALIRLQDREGETFSPRRFAVAYRTIRPDASLHTFEHILEEQLDTQIETNYAEHLYDEYDPEELGLNDLGYLARIHPLELWVLRYRHEHPDGDWEQALADSEQARMESYEWLMKTGRKDAQDRRIRIVLEREAFGRLHDQWRDLGYPFDELVPSYATALGSSSDRPAALSELMGILVNDGVRKPTARFTSLRFGRATPFETELERTPGACERVMRSAVAAELRETLEGVVEEGTAERLGGYEPTVDGRPLELGGKTGTGDNRFEVRNRHGTLVKSVPQNRTATFAFHIDNQFFGSLTAYVPGDQSGEYEFTSSLAVSVLGLLAPKLRPLWWREGGPELERPEKEAPDRSAPDHLVSTAPPGGDRTD